MIILPAILESFRSLKDKSYKIVFETQELTPEQITGIALNTGKFGSLAFKETPFKNSEIEFIDSLDPDIYDDNKKSQSYRIRAALYVLWNKNKEGYELFPDYYKNKTEKYIEHLKSKMD
jgi:hypothetical protein